jgi:hypothetical protein
LCACSCSISMATGGPLTLFPPLSFMPTISLPAHPC